MDTQKHELKRSWLLEYLQKDIFYVLDFRTQRKICLLAYSFTTRGHALTFGGTEGLMLVRREWFNAVSKFKGYGLVLSRRKLFDAGS